MALSAAAEPCTLSISHGSPGSAQQTCLHAEVKAAVHCTSSRTVFHCVLLLVLKTIAGSVDVASSMLG